MQSEEARSRIQAELSYARAARQHGKEGRARVCARRAAGWSVAAYRSAQGQSSDEDAYTLLGWLEERGPEELREPARRLRQQVTEDHRLPHPEDPLKDAELIVDGLLGQASLT
ncbi:MAG: hypothetical protein AABY97_03250 [Chloroflexota bacterium]